jgi:DNA-binding response OmpR family regulator
MDTIESIPRGSETILLIDDEASVRIGIEYMLAKLGYTVYTAENGPDALDIFRRHWHRIDLIILDMVMPEMLGSEVFDRMREIDPGCRVMLASGFGCEEDARSLLERGCLGFLQKPFNIERLSVRIRAILDGLP